MMKRSADQQDVGQIILHFKTVDQMLDNLLKDFTSWRDGWDDILRLQCNATEAFASLYQPFEPTNSPEQMHVPAATPLQKMQKCQRLQKLYSEMKADLQQEIGMMHSKVIRPVQEAKQWMKSLHKTTKHRENMKLDYERYLSRAENARKKDLRSLKEEATLARHESDLAQAQMNYQTADELVKQTFPPIADAVLSLLPYFLANQVMIQTTLVGQIYTNLDEYCRQQNLPSPAASNGEIVSVWEGQFTGLKRELEEGLRMIAGGKVVHQHMSQPEQDSSTMTGLALRKKTSSLVGRQRSHQNLVLPSSTRRSDSAGPRASSTPSYQEEEGGEVAPIKPSRPSNVGAQSPALSPRGIPLSTKLRMPSYSSVNSTAPYDEKSTNVSAEHGYGKAPPSYTETAASPASVSNYYTPASGMSPSASLNGSDYFVGARRASSLSLASSAASIAAAKKKPPPPIPAKKLGGQPTQFVTALYDFDGQNQGDLAFREGDRIRVVKKTDSTDDWWDGELNGRVGMFPANYVQLQ